MSKSSQDSNLDILRSVAVLAVLVTHGLQVAAGLRYGDRFAFGVDTYALGRIGVLLFFVHTSLVLMQSLERTSAGLGGWDLALHFYVRRAFRIYPLSSCLILLSFALSIPPHALESTYRWLGVKWALANLFLVQNIMGRSSVSSPLWSLPFEVQMYLVLPLLFIALKGRRSGGGLTLIYLAGAALSLFFPVCRFVPCFLAGVMAYKLLDWLRPRFAAWLWYPVVTGAVAFYVGFPGSDELWWKDVAVCLAIGAAIPLFRRNGGLPAKSAALIAKYSYGIYLCHTPLLWFFRHQLGLSRGLGVSLALLATGVMSVACYHFIEEPMIRLGSRLAVRLTAGTRGG